MRATPKPLDNSAIGGNKLLFNLNTFFAACFTILASIYYPSSTSALNGGGEVLFIHLKTRFRRTLLAFSCLFIVTIHVVAFLIIYQATYQYHVQLALLHVRQQEQNVQSHMQLLEETSRLIAQNPLPLILKKLGEGGGDTAGEITGLLNDYMTSSLYIRNMGVYAIDGSEYPSMAYSRFPVEDIVRGQEACFKESTGISFWIVRPVRLADAPEGYLTYVSGIYGEDGALLGYLAVNTEIERVFSLYKDGGSRIFKKETSYILTKTGDLLPHGSRSPFPGDFLENAGQGSFTAMDWRNIYCGIPIPKSNDLVLLYMPIGVWEQITVDEYVIKCR
jgi:hypothetical protein